MSRVLVIPDSHLKISVIEDGLELAKKKLADKIVLMGDYFDDWESTKRDYDDMANYLKNLLRTNPSVVPLYGNHELSYIDHKRYGASGYRKDCAKIVENCVKNDYRFLYAWACDSVLYTHAGVTKEWINASRVITKSQARYKMKGTKMADYIADGINGLRKLDWIGTVGPARGGNSVPGPLWCDARELDYDAPAGLSQVVGHTPVKNILHIGSLWLTDVFSNGNDCDEYLLVKDGTPEIISYSQEMGYGR